MSWWKREDDRWCDEPFLRKACDLIARELDWDTINSGCLHRTTSVAQTLDGHPVVIGVLTKPDYWQAVLDDANQDMAEKGLSRTTPLWLYVPEGFPLPPLPGNVIIRTVFR